MLGNNDNSSMGGRLSLSIYAVTVIFIVLTLRLWNLQIMNGSMYRQMAENNRLRVIKEPAPRGIIYDRHNIPLVKNIPSFDISVAGDDLLEDDDAISSLGLLIGVPPGEVKKKISGGARTPLEPVKLKRGVSFSELAIVEARKVDFPGLQVDVVVNREYIYDSFASHVIGYLGRLTQEQSMAQEYQDVPRSAFIGQMGIEKIYDQRLRGIAGERFIEVDAAGRMIKSAGRREAVKGGDITLTIDKNLQDEAEKSLRGLTGAVVVLDVYTGEILTLVSTPSFDPNLFARGIGYREWRNLSKNPMHPMLNRAIQSQYPPGSTFKIITALAALEEGVITSKTTFPCNGYINFGRKFRCWKLEGHGRVDIRRAIAESCDVFFYEVGKRMDIDRIATYAKAFGMGIQSGIDLEGEREGIVPSKEWKRIFRKEKWYKGETLNTVIGQGYLTATPLQVARLMAAVVNGGRLIIPHLVKDRINRDQSVQIIDLKEENVSLIRRSLKDVVYDDEGTGRLARSEVVEIGGKTGTTQVIGKSALMNDVPRRYRDHAWFVSYAPADNPEITVAIFIEHGGHGSNAAAPLAKRIIEAYYHDRGN